jgi:hypothetical protein
MALAQGAGVAVACAFAVGVFSGLTRVQSAYVAILAGWLAGRTIHRGSRDLPAAVAAGIMALAGAALASVIAVSIRITVTAHLPYEIVAAHIARVIPLVPHFIGPFGFICWALAAVVGWLAVRSEGRRRPGLTRAAAHPASTPSGEPDRGTGSGPPS